MGTNSVAIIDDDASANRALGRLLRGAGFDPRGFDSAESFLADPARSAFGCLLVDSQRNRRRDEGENNQVPQGNLDNA